MAEGPPPQTPDLAVRAFIALFMLGAVLHGFDVMETEGIKTSGGWWLIATILAALDWFWARIKSLLGPRFALTANNVATDFRWWVIALMLLFVSVSAPDIYHRQPFLTPIFYYIISGAIAVAFCGVAVIRRRAVPPRDVLMRIDRIEQDVASHKAAVTRIEAQVRSTQKNAATEYQFLVNALHARDAERIITEADKTIVFIGKKLLEASSYSDESTWSRDYYIWKNNIDQIDKLSSQWMEHYAPFFTDRLRDVEDETPPMPPDTIKSEPNALRFKIVYVTQQRYNNGRNNLFIFFSSKGQLP